MVPKEVLALESGEIYFQQKSFMTNRFWDSMPFLKKVKYVDTVENASSDPFMLFQFSDGPVPIFAPDPAIKHRDWRFQNEMRYVIVLNHIGEFIGNGGQDSYARNAPDFEHIDLEIHPKFFSNMVVTLGPKIEELDKKHLLKLIPTIDNKIKVNESIWTGKLR